MPNLVRRTAIPAVQPGQVLSAHVAQAERPAILAVTRVHGGAFVASVAMSNAVMLSRAADVAFRTSPMGEDAYRSILAAYSNLAVAEIQGLSIRGRS